MADTIIIISGKTIEVEALVEAYPGVHVSATYPGNDTRLVWHESSPVPVKTQGEIISAQATFDAGDKKLREFSNSPLLNDDDFSALLDFLAEKFAITRGDLETQIFSKRR